MTWSQQAYLKASNTGVADQFGFSVGVSGDTAVVGAFREGSGTTGVNSLSDEAAIDSGAAYVFDSFDFVSPSLSSSPPVLYVKGKRKIRTTKSRYKIKGYAIDSDGDLARVEASGPKGTKGTKGKKFRATKGISPWKYKAKLGSGRNKVNLRAIDAAGNVSAITKVKIIKR